MPQCSDTLARALAASRDPLDLPKAIVVHLTDGAPLDPALAVPERDPARLQYRDTRRRELEAAMRLVGIDASRLVALDVIDQQTPYALASLAERLLQLVRQSAPATERRLGLPEHGTERAVPIVGT